MCVCVHSQGMGSWCGLLLLQLGHAAADFVDGVPLAVGASWVSCLVVHSGSTAVAAQQEVFLHGQLPCNSHLPVRMCTGGSLHRVYLPQQQMSSVGSALSRIKQYRPAVLHVLFCVWCPVTNCGGLVHALWGRLLCRGLFIS